MSRRRAVPAIAKPVVDVRAALRFAEAIEPDPPVAAPKKAPPAAPAPKPPAPGRVRVQADLPEDLYRRFVKQAERKGRTPAEALERLIRKHVE